LKNPQLGLSQEMIQQAIDTFVRLDLLINNAGILRDRMLVNMTEEEWDLVIRFHLDETFARCIMPPTTGSFSPKPARPWMRE
jgi:NAD(P)-dependent dehydrogenase (short-subunit alcohol dehydrogenase family)